MKYIIAALILSAVAVFGQNVPTFQYGGSVTGGTFTYTGSGVVAAKTAVTAASLTGTISGSQVSGTVAVSSLANSLNSGAVIPTPTITGSINANITAENLLYTGVVTISSTAGSSLSIGVPESLSKTLTLGNNGTLMSSPSLYAPLENGSVVEINPVTNSLEVLGFNFTNPASVSFEDTNLSLDPDPTTGSNGSLYMNAGIGGFYGTIYLEYPRQLNIGNTDLLSFLAANGTSSYATTSGSSAQSGTANNLGTALILASRIPGLVTNGTANASLINAITNPASGNGSGVLIDGSFVTNGTIYLSGTNPQTQNGFLEFVKGGALVQSSTWVGNVVMNYHQTFLNLTGSAGTASPLITSTGSLMGDYNIGIWGAGTIIGNRYTNGGTSYTYVSPWGWTTTAGAFGVSMSGVQNLYLGGFTIWGGAGFQIQYSNDIDPLIENVTVTKPGGSLYTGNDATDDSFHGNGYLLRPVLRNCRSINNSDNGFTLSPNDAQNGLGLTQNIGTIYYPKVDHFYSNGNGPGFYCKYTGTGGPLEADIVGADIGYVILDTPSPSYCYQPSANILSTAEFGANWVGGRLHDWTIGNRGTNSSALVGIGLSGSSTGLVIDNINWTSLPSGVTPIGFSGGGSPSPVSKNITVINCSAVLVSGTTSAPFVGAGSGPKTVNGVTISNNSISGFYGGPFADVDNSAGDNGNIQNIGGSGNVISNSGTAQMIGGYAQFVSGVTGQLARSMGDDSSASYLSLVYSGTNGLNRSTSSANNVSDLINTITSMGLWNQTLGVLFRANVPYVVGTTTPSSNPIPFGQYVPLFGGLISTFNTSAQTIGVSGTMSPLWINNANFILDNIPPALSGSLSKTMIAVFNSTGNSTQYFCGGYDGSNNNSAWRLQATASAVQTNYMNASNSQVTLSGTTVLTTGSNYMAAITWTEAASGTSGTFVLYVCGNGGKVETQTITGCSNFNRDINGGGQGIGIGCQAALPFAQSDNLSAYLEVSGTALTTSQLNQLYTTLNIDQNLPIPSGVPTISGASFTTILSSRGTMLLPAVAPTATGTATLTNAAFNPSGNIQMLPLSTLPVGLVLASGTISTTGTATFTFTNPMLVAGGITTGTASIPVQFIYTQ